MNIYLLDDDDVGRQELVNLLTEQGLRVSGFSDAVSFYQAFVSLPCDVAVINATLAGQNALAIVQTLRHCAGTGIVVVSDQNSPETRRQALECGADAYLAKPIDIRELAAQLRVIHARLTAAQEAAPPESHKSWALKEGGWVLCDPTGNSLRLTTAERALLLCLLQMRGSPVSRDALISTLGGNPRYADPHRIDVLINRLRQKARTVKMNLPLHSVRSKGYMLAIETTAISHEGPLFVQEDSNGTSISIPIDPEHTGQTS
jgi:two-component system, OmpR family, response regulator PhoP